jgi:hypothetical protein
MARKPEQTKKVLDYQKRAEECASWAQSAVNVQARDVFAKMEAYWRKRAKMEQTAGGTADKAEAPLVPDKPWRTREPIR